MIDLSILVCSVHTRYDTFAPKIQKQLYDQYNILSQSDQDRVEIIVLTDNKKQMLGHKRNLMVSMAQGKYIVFVDDDDRVAEDYIQSILEATKSDADSIVFQAEVSLNGGTPKTCYYSKDVVTDHNDIKGYHRIPNHICCIKRSVSLESSFPHVLYGEDAGYSKVLLPYLKTEHKIDKVLYYYDYNKETTETQTARNNKGKPMTKDYIVDVIILSKATDPIGRAMTQKAVDTCFFGANGLPVNIIVLENGNGTYLNATSIKREGKFHYNASANYGAEQGKAEWIMIANNDLIFRDGWLHHLLSAGNDVVSPREPKDSRQKDITENTKGYATGQHFSGWCFMIKRSLWEKIGKFDTDVDFWCSDDAVIEQVKAVGVEPMIVYDSIVDHLGSATLNSQPSKVQNDLRWKNLYIFNTKYGKDKFVNHPKYQEFVRSMK